MSSPTLRLFAGLALTGAASPALADCPEPVPVRELSQTVSLGDAAYTAMDEEAFNAAQADAARMLPCLGEEMTSANAASYHRLQALGAFLERDHAGTVASFRAVLGAAPGYVLPEDLAPPNHPMRVDFEVAQGAVSAPLQPLPRPRTGWVKVDGRSDAEAPVDRPWVFQHLDDDGQVVNTALVPPGGAVPEYASRGRVASAAAGPRLSVPLAVTAGVATVASGALFLAARGSEATFWDPTTPNADLDGLRTRTNTLGWLSAGVGVVAVGAGAGAVISGTW